MEVSDYGFASSRRSRGRGAAAVVRFGFVGTLVWHKGAHVLIEAARLLRGTFHIVIVRRPGVSPRVRGPLAA